MKGVERLLVSVAVVVLLGGSLFDLYEFGTQATRSNSASFTTSSSIGASFTTQSVVTTIINSTVFPPSTTSTSSNTSQTACTTVVPGGENTLFLRVVSDANQTPIAGARVTATHDVFAGCYGSPRTTTEATLAFTTSNAEWYSLDTLFSGSYSIVVNYSGHSYSLSSDIGQAEAETATCLSLYLPSGRTNATITTPFTLTCASIG